MLDVSRWQLTDKGTELPMSAEGDATVLVLASDVPLLGSDVRFTVAARERVVGRDNEGYNVDRHGEEFFGANPAHIPIERTNEPTFLDRLPT